MAMATFTVFQVLSVTYSGQVKGLLLHVRCIPQQNSQWQFWASVSVACIYSCSEHLCNWCLLKGLKVTEPASLFVTLTTSLRGFAFAKFDGTAIQSVRSAMRFSSVQFLHSRQCWGVGHWVPSLETALAVCQCLCSVLPQAWCDLVGFRHEEVEYARHPSAATSRHDLEHARRLVCFGNCCMSFYISVSARLRVYVCKPAHLRVDVNISISYLWHMNTNDISESGWAGAW